MARIERIGSIQDFGPGTGRAVEVAGRTLAVFNVDGKLHAIDNECTHVGGPLAEGTVDGTTVVCPWHGAEFNVCTGESLCPPAGGPVGCYKVEVAGSDVKVELPD